SPAVSEWGRGGVGCGVASSCAPAALRRPSGGTKSAMCLQTLTSSYPPGGGTWREASESAGRGQAGAGSRLTSAPCLSRCAPSLPRPLTVRERTLTPSIKVRILAGHPHYGLGRALPFHSYRYSLGNGGKHWRDA